MVPPEALAVVDEPLQIVSIVGVTDMVGKSLIVMVCVMVSKSVPFEVINSTV